MISESKVILFATVTSLASGIALVLAFGDASCLLLQKVEMGIVQTLAF